MQLITQIANLILKKNQENTFPEIGFLNGRMGEIYFLYYYSLIDHNYEEHADNMLHELLNNIPLYNQNITHTYCNGLAGIGTSLHILEKSGFIELTPDIFEDINIVLDFILSKEIADNNYDFLHGAIGIGFYFLKHYAINPEISLIQIQKILDYLEHTAISDDKTNTLKWKRKESSTSKYDISLSHGISSIIVFLTRILTIENEKINKQKVSKMLEMSVNYILRQELDCSIYGCYFPYTSKEGESQLCKSRLAWCYGDLGIAIALWQAGNSLKRDDIISFSIDVLSYSATRKDLKSDLVMDAGLCHGTGGISQIFYRMYKNTKLPFFEETYEYWREQTLKMSYHNKGLVGYMSYDIIQDQWYNTTSLLEGVSGIGLSLISPICSDWDEALLLNF